jgi:phosphoribosylformylglycinamidine (FGAM) synthase-like enzyme
LRSFPVFLLYYLQFGPIQGTTPAVKKNRLLFAGVVPEISHYGNCIGIPTIG